MHVIVYLLRLVDQTHFAPGDLQDAELRLLQRDTYHGCRSAQSRTGLLGRLLYAQARRGYILLARFNIKKVARISFVLLGAAVRLRAVFAPLNRPVHAVDCWFSRLSLNDLNQVLCNEISFFVRWHLAANIFLAHFFTAMFADLLFTRLL